MPSFEKYKQGLGVKGKTLGEVRKVQADEIMEWTWYGDIQTRTCYLFDMYHDPNPRLLRDMQPADEMIPISIKYIKHTSQTMDKDNISYHMQMKPSQTMCVPYYEEYEYLYQTEFPLGLYILIPDEKGILNRWLIVAKADGAAPQFPTYELLQCNYTLNYIIDGIKWNVAGVLRSQNSYNSGVWQDYRIETVEDQQKIILPLNRDTEHLYYNLRCVIDSGVLTEPRAWHISKINRISPNGLVRITFAQDRYDEHTDFIETEIDELGRERVVAMWADYYKYPDIRDKKVPAKIHGEITCSGTNSILKVGGGYKTLTIQFYKDSDPISYIQGNWDYSIDGVDVSSMISEKTTTEDNQIKIKFTGSDEYIDKILTVTHVTADNITTSINLGIESL